MPSPCVEKEAGVHLPAPLWIEGKRCYRRKELTFRLRRTFFTWGQEMSTTVSERRAFAHKINR